MWCSRTVWKQPANEGKRPRRVLGVGEETMEIKQEALKMSVKEENQKKRGVAVRNLGMINSASNCMRSK